MSVKLTSHQVSAIHEHYQGNSHKLQRCVNGIRSFLSRLQRKRRGIANRWNLGTRQHYLDVLVILETHLYNKTKGG